MDYVLSDGFNSYATATVGVDGDLVNIYISSGDVFSTKDSNVIELLNASEFVQKQPAAKTTDNKESK